MNILFVSPPHTNPVGPTLGTAVLSSFIKKHIPNINVELEDLGVEAIYYLLSKDNIDYCYDRIVAELGMLEGKSEINYCEQKRLKKLIIAKVSLDALCDKVSESIDILKKKETYNIHQMREDATYIINTVLKSLACCYGETELHCGDYRTEYSPFSISDIKKYIEHGDNVYTTFFDNWIKSKKLDKYQYIGISISFAKQVLPAFELAERIKKNYPHLIVQIGGSMLAHMNEEYFEPLFEYCDCIVQREGEYPLLKLLTAINNKEEWTNELGVIFKNEKGVIFPKKMPKVVLDEVAEPDFTGINMSAYLVPNAVVPYQIGRSCYWGKCTFCCLNTAFVHKNCWHSIDKVVSDIEQLTNKYNVKCIEFVDDAIPPMYARTISEKLIEKDIKIKWFGYARFDERFNKEIFSLMHKAGCVGIKFGLESASRPILAKMNKGIDISVARKLFAQASEAGIIPQAAFFVGFPGESLDDIFETIKFIKEVVLNNGIIAYNGIFRLLKSMPLIDDSKSYNICNIEKWNIDEELMDYFHVEYESNVNIAEYAKIVEESLAPMICKDLTRSVDLRRYWFEGYSDFSIKEKISEKLEQIIFTSCFDIDSINDFQDKKVNDFVRGKGIYSRKSYISNGLHDENICNLLNSKYVQYNKGKLNRYKLMNGKIVRCDCEKG